MGRSDSDIAELTAVVRDLRLAWDRAGEKWQDQTRTEFSAQHLDAIERVLSEAAKHAVQTATLLAKVRTDCA